MGLDLTGASWSVWSQVFNVGNPGIENAVPFRPWCPCFPTIHRLPLDHLATYPVDLLVLGSGSPRTNRLWLDRVREAQRSSDTEPRWILEFWEPDFLLRQDGPMTKATTTAWMKEGYHSTCKLVNGLQVGGVVDGEWLIVHRISERGMELTVQNVLRRGFAWPDVGDSVVRPMGNCLRTHRIPKGAYRNSGPKSDLPDSEVSAMPSRPGQLISTPKGTRRLLNDELAKGLGVPKEWIRENYPSGRLLRTTIPLHLLEYSTKSFMQIPELWNPPGAPPQPTSLAGDGSVSTISDSPAEQLRPGDPDFVNPSAPSGIDWKPPDLGPQSEWTRKRVRNLISACLLYENPGPMIEEGLERLRRHRRNYDSDGPRPQQLQILWWEFPEEVWDSLRDGSTMHFLREPDHRLTPNSPMTDDQICIAEEFVEELVALGVLVPVEPGYMVANGPLFTLPKPGQPGQWRIISDMRRGGQNEVSAADPTVFPKPGTILEQLYPGGWTAVVDASKFFYQFPTCPFERKFLGCIHPRDPTRQYVYAGLPMGATASPAHAGRYGAALLRKLRTTSPLFQGQWTPNTWWTHFSQTKAYDPTVGHGLVLMGDDDLPACLVWAHCDDFLIHGPTLMKTMAGVHAFMDLTVDVGMLCNPAKITAPGQSVRYTGLMFDTTGQPTLRIPSAKRSRAQALVTYTLTHRSRISRLSLAVVIGTLESLTSATPDHIGRTYLRHLQNDLHPEGWEDDELPYYSFATLSEDSVEELDFWQWLLATDPGRAARGRAAGTLVPSFGDGSGTGTGGTVRYPDTPTFEMWMGTWSPHVFHFSSNWKELQTLLSTLERAATAPVAPRLRGVTFFYFTDNLVTYFVVSNGTSTAPMLHALVLKIKRLCIQLELHLEVIHIPGSLIIAEGTDGLSRGIWSSPLHSRPSQETLLSQIFAPVLPTEGLAQWARSVADLPPALPVHPQDWSGPWDPHLVFNRLTFWTPPPEVAPQLISFLLQCYVERPYTTCCLLLIPRVMQHRWSRLSRYIEEIGVYSPNAIPLSASDHGLIPLVLLLIPFHTLTLDSPRLDGSPPSALQRFHQSQAAFVRGLS